MDAGPTHATIGDATVDVATPVSVSPPEVAVKKTPVPIVLVFLGAVAFLYFARPVVLPVFMACMAGMTLKPFIRWLSTCHIPPALATRRQSTTAAASVVLDE